MTGKIGNALARVSESMDSGFVRGKGVGVFA